MAATTSASTIDAIRAAANAALATANAALRAPKTPPRPTFEGRVLDTTSQHQNPQCWMLSNFWVVFHWYENAEFEVTAIQPDSDPRRGYESGRLSEATFGAGALAVIGAGASAGKPTPSLRLKLRTVGGIPTLHLGMYTPPPAKQFTRLDGVAPLHSCSERRALAVRILMTERLLMRGRATATTLTIGAPRPGIASGQPNDRCGVCGGNHSNRGHGGPRDPDIEAVLGVLGILRSMSGDSAAQRRAAAPEGTAAPVNAPEPGGTAAPVNAPEPEGTAAPGSSEPEGAAAASDVPEPEEPPPSDD